MLHRTYRTFPKPDNTDATPITTESPVVNVLKNWYVVPSLILNRMELPCWCPSAENPLTFAFTQGTMKVDNDAFRQLSYKQALFIYRKLLWSGHNNSLMPSERFKYEHSRQLENVSSLIPFTPPCTMSIWSATSPASPSSLNHSPSTYRSYLRSVTFAKRKTGLSPSYTD